jgi:hypothetical protein
MKTEAIIKSLKATQKRLNRSAIQMQKDMDKIFQVENPTKEQMKEALLLFGGVSRFKKVCNEIDNTVASLEKLLNYSVENI